MRIAWWLSMCGLAHAYLVGRPTITTGAGWVPPSHLRGADPAMILNTLKESAAELIAAIANPKPQVQATPSQAVAAPVSAMEVEVKTSK